MPDFSLENSFGRLDGKVICGVDEVGRGPLAGPVMAAAVVIPAATPPSLLVQIQDSKKMSPKQREALYEPLLSHCHHAVAEASVAEISKFNILWASMLAMRRAIEALNHKIDVALIDGNRTPSPLTCHAVSIVRGDDKSLSIAAASIIAKVTRDRFMANLAMQYPGYGWERNAGYGTAEHLEALNLLGVTIWHRDSFAPVAELKALRE